MVDLFAGEANVEREFRKAPMTSAHTLRRIWIEPDTLRASSVDTGFPGRLAGEHGVENLHVAREREGRPAGRVPTALTADLLNLVFADVEDEP